MDRRLLCLAVAGLMWAPATAGSPPFFALRKRMLGEE